MDRVCCSGTWLLAPTLGRALTLAIFLFAVLLYASESILAQGLFEASGRRTPSPVPADFFTGTNRGAGLFSSSAFPALGGPGPGIRAFGQPEAPSAAGTRDLALKPVAGNRWLREPSQPGIGTGTFGGSAAGSIGFTGIGRQKGGGFDQFAAERMSGPQQKFASPFSSDNILLRNQASGTTPGTLPLFDARIASSFTLPFNSAAGNFRLSYRDMFSTGKNAMGGNFGTSSGSSSFGTSNLGNGMFLSAGSSYGGRSSAGAAAGGQKHLGPSVGLRLTF
jgi:hypothetical protein